MVPRPQPRIVPQRDGSVMSAVNFVDPDDLDKESHAASRTVTSSKPAGTRTMLMRVQVWWRGCFQSQSKP